MCLTRLLPVWLFALLLAAAGTLNAMAADTSPRALVERAAGDLVRALKANQEAVKQDPALARRLAAETVIPHVDFPRIARWVLGKHWRSANEGQRERFTDAFRDYLINSYVTAMVTYTDDIISHADSVSYPPMRPSDDPRYSTVRSNIRLADGRTVAVDYQMVLNGQDWKIYDLSIEGVSLALTYRADFGEAISRSGLDDLIRQLREHSPQD